MEKHYTKPILKKTTKAWYVEFFCLNPVSGKMEQVRKKANLNRIKDLDHREREAELVIFAYHNRLLKGWNPFDEAGNVQLRKDTVSITIKEAKDLFEKYHNDLETRKKTIQTYASKLNYLIAHFPEDTKVNTITTQQLNEFFLDVVNMVNADTRKEKWSNETYKAGKRILNSFFNWLLKEKYITVNPLTGLDKIKINKHTPDVHAVFSDEDFTEIRRRMKLYDPYSYFFSTFILSTCARPKEIRQLTLANIDLENGRITLPASIHKTNKKRTIEIEPDLRTALEALELDKYKPTDFLVGDTTNIIGSTQIGENTPYSRFVKILKGDIINRKYKLEGDKALEDLSNKHYSLYAYKHYSCIYRYTKLGWSIGSISKLINHGSPLMTEKYFKGLNKYIDNSKLAKPSFL